jgi:carbonic anhydrase/acetyltransferase-like protein (isoleucine patch superfamily)
MQEMRRVGGFFVAGSAVIVGDVKIGADSSVWHGCVLRGDVAPIRIGERVSIQDGAVLHCRLGVPLEVGDEVVIGHRAVVHTKRVGRRSLIGIGAAVLDDSEIGEGCLIAAGAVVPPGSIIPPRSVVMGMPGKVVRAIRAEEEAYIDRVVKGYVELARRHAAGEFPPIRE